MTGLRGFSVPFLMTALLTTSVAAAPPAQSTARGRAIFDQKGCQDCHSYVSRRVGPSVRDLLRDFVGEPVKVAKAINAVREHQDELRSGKVSTQDLRVISEWLASDFWPDDESDESAEAPKASVASTALATPLAPATPVAPVAKAAAAVAPAAAQQLPGVPAPLTAQKPAAPAATTPQAVSAVQPSGPSVKAIRLQKEKGGVDRLLIELAGEPDEIDLQTINGQLVVKFSGTQLAGSAPRSLAGGDATVVGSVQASGEQRSVELTVVPRVADWTYTAVQGKARLTIDLTATAPPRKALAAGKPATAKVAADSRGAKTEKDASPAPGKTAATAAAVAKAPAALAAPAAAGATKATAAAAGTAGKPEPKQPVAIARAEPDTATQARREAEATRARQDAAKAKAAEEAAAQATLKREAEARAKREAEAQAKAKRDVDADASWQAAEAQSAGKTQRKVSKRPYKEPKLDPCPPASPADQVIGVVDVERAKEIIDRIGCPQCHAYVQKKTGPPFKEVLKKYSGDPACVVYRLKTNETHKDEGVTKDIRPHEFKILADYVATRMKKD